MIKIKTTTIKHFFIRLCHLSTYRFTHPFESIFILKEKIEEIDNDRWKFIDKNPIDEVNDNAIGNPIEGNRQSMVVVDWIDCMLTVRELWKEESRIKIVYF